MVKDDLLSTFSQFNYTISARNAVVLAPATNSLNSKYAYILQGNFRPKKRLNSILSDTA